MVHLFHTWMDELLTKQEQVEAVLQLFTSVICSLIFLK